MSSGGDEMPKVSKETAPNVQDFGVAEDRNDVLEGYTVNFVTIRQDSDLAPMFKGLPDDRCSCPHWGFVFKGKLTFKSASGDETFETGDAYYVPPGHTPVLYAGTEVVEFSPTKELHDTLEIVEKNMQAAEG